MSLRLRLTILYSSMVVGGLLIFGSLAYGLVSLTLLSQVDKILTEASTQIIQNLRISEENKLDLESLAQVQISDEVFFQIWATDGTLYYTDPSWLTDSLTGSLEFSDSTIATYAGQFGSLRVMNLAIETARRPVGTLLVAQPLGLVETAQQRLVSIMLLLAAVIAPISGLTAWFLTRQALKPLIDMTHMATQITNADDLHRRIALSGPPGDEVGHLMEAFNQTMERLENLFNAQNRFIADVSHELRTPLTVIKGNVGLMKRLGCGDQESLDSISAEVDRLTRLVGDLLLLAQAETGNLPMVMQVVELDTVLFEIFQQMKMLAGERVELKISEIEPVRVKGDPDRLKQVMLNLISNAIQHTPSGGCVDIRMGKSGRQGFFSVSDTGPGISDEDLSFIFERFYRGEKSRTREKVGTGFGLGLSIARWIVNNHNGKIFVETEVGKGTTFTVSLNLWDDPSEWEQVD